MTSSTNKPGRKDKDRQYRMMRIRVDTWTKLATFAASRPTALPPTPPVELLDLSGFTGIGTKENQT